MKALFYQALVRAAKLLGPWVFVLVAKGIATGYFLFSRQRRQTGRRFYRALFPERSPIYPYYATWKQFLSFTTVFFDRFIQREIKDLTYRFQGRRHIVSTHKAKTGGILLMSHMGNWEMAAHLLTKVIPDLQLLLYMGIGQKEEIEKLQKQSIRQDGIRIVGIGRDGGTPFDIIEGIHCLQEGGIVSMAGDIVWREDQQTVTGTFLGRPVSIPEAPFVLSLVSHAPLIVFFAFRTDTGSYRFSALPPIHVTAPTRQARSVAIQDAAQQYLTQMESALRQYPFQWYHFDDFIRS